MPLFLWLTCDTRDSNLSLSLWIGLVWSVSPDLQSVSECCISLELEHCNKMHEFFYQLLSLKTWDAQIMSLTETIKLKNVFEVTCYNVVKIAHAEQYTGLRGFFFSFTLYHKQINLSQLFPMHWKCRVVWMKSGIVCVHDYRKIPRTSALSQTVNSSPNANLTLHWDTLKLQPETGLWVVGTTR